VTLRTPVAEALATLQRRISALVDRDVSASELAHCLIAGHNPDDLVRCLTIAPAGDVGSPVPGKT
jgi:hypothetical protein